MYQSALDLFCVCIIILFCFLSASCGLVPDMKNPTLKVSKGDQIDIKGGGKGTYGVGELDAELNIEDNLSKKFDRSAVRLEELISQLKSSQDKMMMTFGGEHTDNSNKKIENDIKSNTEDDYVAGNQHNNFFNVGINHLNSVFLMLLFLLIPSPLNPILRAIKRKIVGWIDVRKSRN